MGTEINILKITKNIKIMIQQNPKEQTWTFFIDLKSAFDKVDHRILIRKLKNM